MSGYNKYMYTLTEDTFRWLTVRYDNRCMITLTGTTISGSKAYSKELKT